MFVYLSIKIKLMFVMIEIETELVYRSLPDTQSSVRREFPKSAV